MHSLWKDVAVDRYVFKGANSLGLVNASLAWPWLQQKTGTPGAIVGVDDGLKIPLAATVEAEANRLYMGSRPYRVADLVFAKFVVACSATLPAGAGIAFGLAKTPADDPDANDEGVWFKVLAGNSVVVESDDGTTDVDDVDTALTLGLTFKVFHLNFRDGVWQGDPRSGGAVGGPSAIIASMDNAAGNLVPVGRGSRLTLAAASGPLQPFCQITKGSQYSGQNLYVREIEIGYRRQSYAVSDTVATTTTTTTTTTHT